MAEKKINLLVLPELFPSRIGDIKGIFVLDYLSSVKQWCNIQVLATSVFGNPGLTEEKVDGVQIFRYNLVRPFRYAKYLKPFLYLLLLLKTIAVARTLQKPDVIHVHGVVINGTLSLLLKKKLLAPIVMTIHTGPFSKLTNNALVKQITQRVISKVDLTMPVSKDLETQIHRAGMKPKKVSIIGNPVDTNTFHIMNSTTLSARKTIVFCSRLEDYKGGLMLLKAFHRSLHKLGEEWKLHIVGEGPERVLIQDYVSVNKLTQSVKLSGFVSKRKLNVFFNESSFFVFPSEHETFGLVAAEAMASGLPVITSRNTAMEEYVSVSNGLLVNPTNNNELKDAILEMTKNLDNYNPKQIRETIVGRFGFEVFGAKLKSQYESLIECVE